MVASSCRLLQRVVIWLYSPCPPRGRSLKAPSRRATGLRCVAPARACPPKELRTLYQALFEAPQAKSRENKSQNAEIQSLLMLESQLGKA